MWNRLALIELTALFAEHDRLVAERDGIVIAQCAALSEMRKALRDAEARHEAAP